MTCGCSAAWREARTPRPATSTSWWTLDRGVGVVAPPALKRELAELLGVDVDVVPAETLKARIRAEVLAEAIHLCVGATTRLRDIVASAEAIASHLRRGGLDDGLVFDAVRVRLIEVGEAVQVIAPELPATEADIPWRDVAGMGYQLAHRYFDTAHWIVQATIDEDLPALVAAAQRMLIRLGSKP